jgi:hypothetical protein
MDLDVFTCLRHLNAVRNACVHNRDKAVGIEDLDKIGQALDREYQELRTVHEATPSDLAMAVFGAVFGRKDSPRPTSHILRACRMSRS